MTTKQVQVRQWANSPEYAGKPGYRHGRVILHCHAVVADEYELALSPSQGWAERIIVNGAAWIDVDMNPIEEPLFPLRQEEDGR